ncbi:nuclear transport factor 2 family protein [Streptomyces sp. NPDC049577]|uniref:nuclear transport factor 2 family protein n=1 Tax=Streptomyces sp. NPDC049577 TaxID=3155153 RepID=UPI00343B6CC4
MIVEFVRRLALGDPGSAADLFTPDGTWAWAAGDRRIAGREALRDHFGGRPTDRLSRRMCTNILVTVASPETATATTYFATYRVDGPSEDMVPPRLPAQVGHYHVPVRRRSHGTRRPA